MRRSIIIAVVFFIFLAPATTFSQAKKEAWTIAAIPSSIRIDPVTNKVIEDRFLSNKTVASSVASRNWIYDGTKVKLSAAKGEYVSFQVLLTNRSATPLKGIAIDMSSFKKDDSVWDIEPELFLEWSVEVKTPSTGYPKATLGNGWYPDALIPMQYIQQKPVTQSNGWVYPLQLPDFNNRIDKQISQIFWVDQYIPLDASPGTYTAEVEVTIDNIVKKIPVEINIWNFTVPNENNLKASLQHEG
nr:hypothetical protein [Chitinophagaceae bacterium]